MTFKAYFNLLLLGGLFIACTPQSHESAKPAIEEDTEIESNPYDSLKAATYGADEYGMKSYVMAFLKAGPNQNLDSARAIELQMAHLSNIDQMAKDGKLLLAGPFLDTGEVRGIYIFDVQTIEEAKALTETDPAIQAGSLVMELKPWYGSAALMELNDIHQTLSKTNPSDPQ